MSHHIHETMDPAAVECAADLIRQADALIIAAGAGMGVDSGLPDFRGQDGFWRAYPALAKARIDFYRIASPATFHASPELAWGFYGHRLALYRRTLPHHGFELMFSDWDWIEDRSAAQASRQEAWLSAVKRPVVIELGAGTAIPSVRHFSQRVLHEFGGRLIRINPRECEVSSGLDVGMPVGAVAGLDAIAQLLGPDWQQPPKI